jgi:hypothetical protein
VHALLAGNHQSSQRNTSNQDRVLARPGQNAVNGGDAGAGAAAALALGLTERSHTGQVLAFEQLQARSAASRHVAHLVLSVELDAASRGIATVLIKQNEMECEGEGLETERVNRHMRVLLQEYIERDTYINTHTYMLTYIIHIYKHELVAYITYIHTYIHA